MAEIQIASGTGGYLSEGTLAARPAAPLVATGGLAFYLATDQSPPQLFVWSASAAAWAQISSSGGTGVPGGSNHQVQYNNAGAFGGLAQTNGQLLIGSTGATPVPATLTAGANVTITNAAGSITIAASGGGGGGGTFTVTQKTGNYTVQASDPGKAYEWEDSAAVTITLPDAGVAFFPNGSAPLIIMNNGSGAGVITINCSTSLINTNSSLTLGPGNGSTGMAAFIVSDGTNYYALVTSPFGALTTTGIGSSFSTSSASTVMAGLVQTITPQRPTDQVHATSSVLVNITGNVTAGSASSGPTLELRFGTGTPPVNGAASTGTLVGVAQVASADMFALTGVITGLTPGTAAWVDIGFKTPAGPLTIANVNLSLTEL